jgi:hypothetical protein
MNLALSVQSLWFMLGIQVIGRKTQNGVMFKHKNVDCIFLSGNRAILDYLT